TTAARGCRSLAGSQHAACGRSRGRMGTRERQQAAHIALEVAVTRLSPLPIPQLAPEVMAQLRPDAPDAASRPLTAPELVEGFAAGSLLAGLPAQDNELRRQL